LIFAPTVFDRYVPAFDKAEFLQALENRWALCHPITGVACCWARAATGHAAAAPPRSVMNSRRSCSLPQTKASDHSMRLNT